MVDSFTSNRNIIQPLVGGDSGTWGGLLNSGVAAQLDLILGATQGIAITIADVTLTTSEWNNCAIKLTGALTGNRSLLLPFNVNSSSVAVGGYFVVDNQTSGAFNVTVKTVASGSTGVTVPQGLRTWLYSDTTNVYYADDSKVQLLTGSGNPNGVVAGTAGSINTPPSMYWDYLNAQLYFCTTTGNAAAAVWGVQQPSVNRGFNAPINLQLSVTHTGGNLLSVAVKTVGGTDPTVTNPVICAFQTVSGANTTGTVTPVNITTALSMTTNATGATLGSSNSTPFRIWLALFNSAGTAVLAMRNCSTAASVLPLAEYGVASTVSISGSAASAGVWYTPNGTTLSNCAFRIIGYVEYTGGLATAGTYTSDPSNTVVFGPGVQKPGAVVQSIYASTTTPTTVTGPVGASATALTGSITPTSAINIVKASVNASIYSTGSTTNRIMIAQIYRATGSVAIGNVSTSGGGGGAVMSQPVALLAFDKPAAATATQYGVYISVTNGADSWVFLSTANGVGTNTGVMILDEIMG